MLTSRLPNRIEAGARKDFFYSTEIVTTDGGLETRNARWTEPAEEWRCSIPACKTTDPDFLDTLAVYHAALGSFDSFLFHDFVNCVDVEVRFKDDTFTVDTVGNKVATSFVLKRIPGSPDSNSP